MHTFSTRFFVLLVPATLWMGSCTSLEATLATPIPPTPMELPSPTATILWFPPTATPTPEVLLTRAATPEMRPGLGDTVLTDKLSNSSLWDTATSDEGSAKVDDNRLNLSAQSGVYMVSLRQNLVVNDFYAEITARAGLCRGEDTYGFLVRANAVAYYRFALSCNGMVAAERVSGAKRQILQEAVPSGDAPPGAPGEVRIGIWAVGHEMRLFLNGRYQFSITDANYASGTVGVFVNAAGNTPAVVSFSDLSVQEVSYFPPEPTPEP